MAALSKDESVGDLLVKRHFYHHRKLRTAWLSDPRAVAEMTAEQVDAVKSAIADIDKNHPESKRDPFVLGKIEGDGQLIALYNAVFRAASGDAAHISLDALNRHAPIRPPASLPKSCDSYRPNQFSKNHSSKFANSYAFNQVHRRRVSAGSCLRPS
jgi:hypothetical protein